MLRLSKQQARPFFQYKWLTPKLHAIFPGRPLRSEARRSGVGRVNVPVELCRAAYGITGHAAAYIQVVIQLKVPAAAADAAVEALFGSKSSTEGARGATGAEAVEGWHGVEVVVVGELEALLRVMPHRCCISNVGKRMRGFQKWRLFALEVVSRGSGFRARRFRFCSFRCRFRA